MFQLRRLHWLLLASVFFAGCSSNDMAVRKQAPAEKAPAQTAAPAPAKVEAAQTAGPAKAEAPAAKPAPRPEPKPAPVVAKPKPAPKPAPVAVKPAPKPAPEPVQVAKPAPKPEPAGPVITTLIPSEIVEFLKDDRAAVKSADSSRVMANYHPDFLSDGRDYGTQEALFLAYGPKFAEKWDVKIKKVKIEGDTVTILEGTGATAYGVADMAGTKLVKQDGHWLWLGNGKM